MALLEGSFLLASAVAVVALVASGFCCCCCCCCLGSRKPDRNEPQWKVTVDNKELNVEHLNRRKELITAYIVWFTTGLFGTHHFYLERLLHGFMALYSLNFLGMGWLLDGFMMSTYIQWANVYAPVPPHTDGTCRLLSLRLPLIGLVALMVPPGLFVLGPPTLHLAGVIDVDQGIAGTARNPYDILGVPRRSDPAYAIDLTRAELGKFPLEKQACKGECKRRKDELLNILDFLEGFSWKRDEPEVQAAMDPSERRWNDWADFAEASWIVTIEEAKKAFGLNSTSGKGGRTRQRKKGGKGKKGPKKEKEKGRGAGGAGKGGEL